MVSNDDVRLVAQMAAAIYWNPEWASGKVDAVDAAIEILEEARKQVAAMAPSEGDAAPKSAPDKPRLWRHKKRGTIYQEIGTAKLQIAMGGPIWENDVLMIYRSEDGQLWARELSEFSDGRFEQVSGPADGAS